MSLRDEIVDLPKPDSAGYPAFHEVTASRTAGDSRVETVDSVADETPVAMVYNGEPHVVMLATPGDLEDFAVGFSLSEGIIKEANEIQYLEVTPCRPGIQIHIRVPYENGLSVAQRQRNLAGRTGCGLCGTALIEDAVKKHR